MSSLIDFWKTKFLCKKNATRRESDRLREINNDMIFYFWLLVISKPLSGHLLVTVRLIGQDVMCNKWTGGHLTQFPFNFTPTLAKYPVNEVLEYELSSHPRKSFKV